MVDRFSGDETTEIGRTNGVRVIQANANRSAARNIGFMDSSGMAVLFVDSDMILTERVLEDCITGLAEHDALVIPEISSGTGFWTKCKALERQVDLGNDLVEAARCFRKSALVSLGGYDPAMEAGEDWDLHLRVSNSGFLIGRVSEQIVHLEGNLTITKAFLRKYKYGRVIRRYIRKHPSRTTRQLNIVSRLIRLGSRAAKQDPSLGVGVMVLKSVEFLGASIGFVESAIRETLRGISPSRSA